MADLVLQGKSPEEISQELGLTQSTVESYLFRAVGEGLLRRSDVYFSLPQAWRESESSQSWYEKPISILGDMYEDLRAIEVGLHERISTRLVEQFGSGENQWWRQGVPLKVRVRCVERREHDSEDPCEPFRYVNFLDLWEVLKSSWSDLAEVCGDYRSDRKRLEGDLRRLNRIRNQVMHPVRGYKPTEEDFEFVRHVKQYFSL